MARQGQVERKIGLGGLCVIAAMFVAQLGVHSAGAIQCSGGETDGFSCDDGNPCTVGDVCWNQQCQPGSVATGNACDDGDVCTIGESCQSDGSCGGGSINGACGCCEFTSNTGGGEFGTCTSPVTEEDCEQELGGFFEQGGICNTQSGVCQAGGECGNGQVEGFEQCDDGNQESGDCCDASCQFESQGAACKDGNPCTLNDSCDGSGICTGGSANPQCGCCEFGLLSSVFDSSARTLEGACEAPVEEQSCRDSLGEFFQGASCNLELGTCELAAVCGNGTVEIGEQCDDGNLENGDCCDSSCQFEELESPCSDGNACTDEDYCNGEGTCVSGVPVSCNDSNECTTDVCDPQQGCTFTPNNDPCDDGNACTFDDTCSDGQCIGTLVSCQPPVPPCESGEFCNPSSGLCEALPDAPTTVPCELDQNVCTVDRCDGNGSCQFVENAEAGTPCDDGLFCNGLGDTCDGSGQCQHPGDPCSGGSECSRTCNEAADNCFDPVGTPCSEDGLVCTADQCDGSGICGHTQVPVSQCPKGYVILEAPASATVNAEVAYTSQVKGGSACAENVRLRQASLLDGNAIGPSGVRVGKDAVASGMCVTAGASVILGVNAQCLAGTDTSGTHTLLSDCSGASDLAEQRRQMLLALSADQSLGSVTVGTSATHDITPFSTAPGDVVVIDYDSLTIKPNRTLTIKGNANTAAVVIRISGNLRVRLNGKIVTQGIPAGPGGSPAERVLFLVGGTAELRRIAEVQGTIFSQGTLTVRRDAQVTGALVSAASPLRVRPSVEVVHAPWVLW